MDVHPAARLARNQLGDEGDDPPVLAGHAVADVLRQRGGVAHEFDGQELELDLVLGAAHLVVVVFHQQPDPLEGLANLIAQGEMVVVGLGAEVAPIAVDAIKLGPARRTGQLAALDAVGGLARGHRAVELVEDVKLEFQADADLVRDALRLQRRQRLPNDVPQVLVEVRLGADVEMSQMK